MARWLALAVLLAPPAPSLARVRPSELAALMYLYEHTDGANWKNSTNWDVTKDPCRAFSARVPYRYSDASTELFQGEIKATPWYGVGCVDPCDDYLDGPGCTVGRITSLRLSGNNLAGDISGWAGLGEMRNLSYLDLGYNSLVGSIPSQIGRINNLEYLILRDNSLSGPLPASLGDINSNGDAPPTPLCAGASIPHTRACGRSWL